MSAPQSKRSVHLLSSEQLRRKREGDKNAQRSRRERLKVQIEELQGQVAHLEEKNRTLEARLSAVSSSSPRVGTTLSSRIVVSAGDAATAAAALGCAQDDKKTRQASTTAKLTGIDHDWATPSNGSKSDGAGLPRCEESVWEDLPGDPAASMSAELDTSMAASSEQPNTWNDEQLKPNAFPVLSDNPLGVSFTVWRDFISANEVGPGGLPVEYAAAVESMAALQSYPNDTTDTNHPNNNATTTTTTTTTTTKNRSLTQREDNTPQAQPQQQPPPSPYHTITGNQVWAAIPRHSPPTCLVDRVMLDIVRQRRLHDNASEFHSRPFPSIQSLLNPYLNHHVSQSPVTSSIVNNILHVTMVPTLPEQIAILYVMSTIIRWQIAPTEDHYDAMPVWLRPGAAQLAVPHPPWVDLMAWPKARERICRWPKYHAQHALISAVCNESISINWPYHVEDIILRYNSDEAVVLNPVFDRHIKNIDNWTVGMRMLMVFPELRGEVNIK